MTINKCFLKIYRMWSGARRGWVDYHFLHDIVANTDWFTAVATYPHTLTPEHVRSPTNLYLCKASIHDNVNL